MWFLYAFCVLFYAVFMCSLCGSYVVPVWFLCGSCVLFVCFLCAEKHTESMQKARKDLAECYADPTNSNDLEGDHATEPVESVGATPQPPSPPNPQLLPQNDGYVFKSELFGLLPELVIRAKYYL